MRIRQIHCTIALFVAIAANLFIIPSEITHAESLSATKIDAVFAVDVSGSMKTSDKNGISSEAMKMFIDMAPTQGDQIGIIAYTHQIIREKALLQISSAQDKADLKTFIGQLDRNSFTDTGVGLNEAVKILNSGKDDAHVPMIVLLTDGNTMLPDGASIEESENRLNRAIAEAKDKGYPVYAIGLNADGNLNTDVLQNIADQTGGKMFIANNADNLPQILSEIYASHLKLKVVPVAQYVSSGNFDKVEIDVPNASVQEANISIMSAQPVELQLQNPQGTSVSIPSSDVIYSKSKAYSLLKLVKPVQGNWSLLVKGVPKDKVLINLVYNYDLALGMTPNVPQTAMVGDTVDFTAFFETNGVRLDDPELYKDLTGKLVVTNDSTGQSTELPLLINEHDMTGQLELTEEGPFTVHAVAAGDNFLREAAAVTIQVDKPQQPATAKPAASANPPGTASPQQAEKEAFPWLIVLISGLAVIVVLAGAIFILAAVKRASRGFVGQVVVEIRDENTGERTSPQYKHLQLFKGKFTLHQLLALAPEFAECSKVIFKPGVGDTLLLHNQSACLIEKNGRAIDALQGSQLRNNEKVKIVLQNVQKSITLEYIK